LRFTVRRPANAEVSPCCHRPSGGDIARGVHVGVARPRAAGHALEDRLTLTVFGRNMAARGAALGRVRGRYPFDPTKGFVLQAGSKQTPSASADAAIQPSLLGHSHTGSLWRSPRRARHTSDIKCFNTDRFEAPRDVSGVLLDPVATSVGLSRFQHCNSALRTGSPGRASLRTGEPLLKHPKSLRLPSRETGCVQQFTSRQGCRHGNAAVYTHDCAVTWSEDGIGNVGEGDEPTAGPIARDAVGLHTFRDRPREAKANPADLRHPHPTHPVVETLDVVRLDRDLSESLMHVSFAPGRATVRPGKEVTHRLSEVPQRLLLHGLRAGSQPVVFGSGRGQLRALFIEARGVPAGLPILLLFDSEIPHISRVATVLAQYRLLLRRRKQSKSCHVSNVAKATDMSSKETAFAFVDTLNFCAPTAR
jgi:hypothetical protein